MTHLTKLEFDPLEISGKNYLSWVLDAEIHLMANNLGDTITVSNKSSVHDRAKAMIFLRHHLDKSLKDEYLTVKDPFELWEALADRFAHQKIIVLPRARYEWTHLRLQDFNSVTDFNSAMHRITSQLKLCGEPVSEDSKLEKTFSTFHATNMILQQQYRERGFKKYADLISCLLVAEQNNELLMKNHQSRPTGSQPIPEVNAIFTGGHANRHGNKHGNTSARVKGRDRQRPNGQGRGSINQRLGPKKNAKIHKGKGQMNKSPKNNESFCTRCGCNGHFWKTCRMPDHLVALYQASIKGNKVEINYIDQSDPWDSSEPLDTTPLDISDFFVDNGQHIDDMISGGVLGTD
ncbi:uncharacterized protein LOC112200463 [Rosa chinensis]|uniref:uncharacterized protein LOC112200463 n=1 Tax=Rosa chinensis TaxID=74649 RepID=UPI001AD932A2|nr:uncharacterized protein LOC112200463 [Rosa chinensis]